ncbi:hypothetical protein Tco_1304080 [Tanacetum coccineum]
MDEECLIKAKISKKEILKETMGAHRVYTLDYMETEDAQDMGRTRDVVEEEKENDEDALSTEDVLNTAQQKVSTDKEKVLNDQIKVLDEQSNVLDDHIEEIDPKEKERREKRKDTEYKDEKGGKIEEELRAEELQEEEREHSLNRKERAKFT